jgi:hypothetical protein
LVILTFQAVILAWIYFTAKIMIIAHTPRAREDTWMSNVIVNKLE